MKYFQERLKSARKMNGLSYQELSDKLKNVLSKQDLNRLELGTSNPDSRTLSLLSNALSVTNDFFFKDQIVSLENVEFRKLSKFPKKQQEVVKSKTTEFLERYLEIENLLGINKLAPFKFQEFIINDESDIEEAAIKLRNLLKIGTDPIFNINELLEENGIKIFPIKSKVSFSGLSAKVADNLMVIVYNDDNNIPIVRKRFTLLHELAHLYLDLSQFDEKQSEKFCDNFAGAMLLPAKKLKEYFGGKRDTVFMSELKSIKEYFGISISGIMYRAKFLNLISEHYHKYFMIKYNQFYKKDEINGYDGTEQSQRFIQLLMRAIAHDVISTTKASSLNNQKLGDFRKKYLDVITE